MKWHTKMTNKIEWKNTKEERPEVGTTVILYLPNHVCDYQGCQSKFKVTVIQKDHEICYLECQQCSNEPVVLDGGTYWARLPYPPKSAGALFASLQDEDL